MQSRHAHVITEIETTISSGANFTKRVALGELSRPPRTRGGRLVNGEAVSAAARQKRRKSRGYGGFQSLTAPGRALGFEAAEQGYESNPEGCSRSRFATLSNSRALWFTDRLRLAAGLLSGLQEQRRLRCQRGGTNSKTARQGPCFDRTAGGFYPHGSCVGLGSFQSSLSHWRSQAGARCILVIGRIIATRCTCIRMATRTMASITSIIMPTMKRLPVPWTSMPSSPTNTAGPTRRKKSPIRRR